MTFLTGLIYPLLITGVAQLLFPWQANGSLLRLNGQWIGSQLIGQSFTDNRYFWGRPSATTPYPYNAENSSGSNAGPSNPAFLAIIKTRAAALTQSDPQHQELLPVDLVTASGSGLDPDISPLAAFYQVSRIAKARAAAPEKIIALIKTHTTQRSIGMLGEPRINVLQLNLALDQNIPMPDSKRESRFSS